MKIPVLLPKIFNYPLTYSSNLSKNLQKGDIVEVPFGKSKEIGVVWNGLQNTEKKIRLRSVGKKIEKINIDKKLIKFIDWFSVYNIVPKGMVLKMFLGDKSLLKKSPHKFNDFKITDIKKFLLNKEQKN